MLRRTGLSTTIKKSVAFKALPAAQAGPFFLEKLDMYTAASIQTKARLFEASLPGLARKEFNCT
jgi:hypothetical protein